MRNSPLKAYAKAKSDGSTAKISTASNRDVWKRGERT